MNYLLDTNILLRSAEPAHPMNAEAVEAVALLLDAGEIISIVPQNMSEFRLSVSMFTMQSSSRR